MVGPLIVTAASHASVLVTDLARKHQQSCLHAMKVIHVGHSNNIVLAGLIIRYNSCWACDKIWILWTARDIISLVKFPVIRPIAGKASTFFSALLQPFLAFYSPSHIRQKYFMCNVEFKVFNSIYFSKRSTHDIKDNVIAVCPWLWKMYF